MLWVTAVAQIRPLTQELPYDTGVVKKRHKKTKKMNLEVIILSEVSQTSDREREVS